MTSLPAVFNLKDVFKFLTILEIPSFESISAKKRFLKKDVKFFVQNGRLYQRMQARPPLLVIFDLDKYATILNQAHDELDTKEKLLYGRQFSLGSSDPTYFQMHGTMHNHITPVRYRAPQKYTLLS